MPASKTVRSADRALAVLEVLGAGNRPRSLADLARELAIPKSTLHALLWTLADRGWVEVEEDTGRFRLGLQALLVGRSYLEADGIVAAASSALTWLADETGETAHLGRLDGASIVYLDKRESRHPLRLFSAIGRRLPAFTTALGKVILAQLPDEELVDHLPDPMVPSTPASLVSLDALRADLRRTLERGYAVDNEESTPGVRGFAVALPTSHPPQDAMSCAVPLTRLSEQRESEIVASLHAAAEEVRRQTSGITTSVGPRAD
jgi:DNA-binding IclR family transcriptional regulator